MQVSFNIPEVERPRLEKILLDGIEELWRGIELPEHWDNLRWVRLFNKGMCPYFRNLREVKRFLSALKFYAGLFRTGNSYEVDMVDLVALQVLREFEPEVYGSMIAAKEALIGSADVGGTLPGNASEKKDVLEGLLKSARQEAQVLKILDQIFPAFEPTLKAMVLTDEGNISPAPRIANPQTFERYFYFRTAEGDISEGELKTFLQAPRHLRTGSDLLRSLNKTGRVDALFRRLRGIEPKSYPNPEATINSFFDIGDEFPTTRGRNSYFSVFHDAVYLAERLVSAHGKDHDAYGLLINAVSSGASLGFSSAVLEEMFNTKSDGEPVLTDDEVKNLKKSWARKVREVSISGNLVRNMHLADILERWSAWDNDVEPRRWLEQQIASPDVIDVIRSFLVTDRVMEGREVVNSITKVNVARLSKFANLASIQNQIPGMLNKDLTAEQREICELFQYSYSKMSPQEKEHTARQP